MSDAKFEDLFNRQLDELYDAENQIAKALPKMIAATSSEDLARALQEHLDQTKEHIRRLERIFEAMSEQPGSGKSAGMEGLLTEGERLIADLQKSMVLDAGLIGAAQKVEQYEVAAYRMARGIAEILAQQDTVELLQETLDEEMAMAEDLEDFAETILTGEEPGGELETEIGMSGSEPA